MGWQLVHFIRRLPKLTPEEIARMEELNPKTPDEWREEQEEQDFLEGRDTPAGGKAETARGLAAQARLKRLNTSVPVTQHCQGGRTSIDWVIIRDDA